MEVTRLSQITEQLHILEKKIEARKVESLDELLKKLKKITNPKRRKVKCRCCGVERYSDEEWYECDTETHKGLICPECIHFVEDMDICSTCITQIAMDYDP